MTFRQVYLCTALFTLSLIGSLGLLAIAFNIVSIPNPTQIAVEYARSGHHVHNIAAR